MDISNIFSGDIPQAFKGLLEKGKFVSKTNLEAGDLIEFVYDGDRKYALVLNPKYEEHIHAIALKDLTNEQFLQLIYAWVLVADPQTLYETIKPLVKSTRSYRTYSITKVLRTRLLRYELTLPEEPEPKEESKEEPPKEEPPQPPQEELQEPVDEELPE